MGSSEPFIPKCTPTPQKWSFHGVDKKLHSINTTRCYNQAFFNVVVLNYSISIAVWIETTCRLMQFGTLKKLCKLFSFICVCPCWESLSTLPFCMQFSVPYCTHSFLCTDLLLNYLQYLSPNGKVTHSWVGLQTTQQCWILILKPR